MPLEIMKGKKTIHGAYSHKRQRRLLEPKKWEMFLTLLEEIADGRDVGTGEITISIWNQGDGPATIKGMLTKESAPELWTPLGKKLNLYGMTPFERDGKVGVEEQFCGCRAISSVYTPCAKHKEPGFFETTRELLNRAYTFAKLAEEVQEQKDRGEPVYRLRIEQPEAVAA